MRIHEWNKSAGVTDAKGINSGPGKSNANRLQDILVEGCKVKREEDSFRSSLQKSMNLSKSMHIRIETSAAAKMGKEVPVREIPYSECDMVEINVLEGYVLKAKREKTGEGEEQGGQIYVEKKNDEGEVRAYLFNSLYVRPDGGDEMERMAYTVMKGRGK